MNIFKSIFLFVVTGAVVLGFNSCKKITQDQLINGLWKVNAVYVDTATTNYLSHLPHYNDGNNCCAYKLDFEKDGSVIAYYITYNSFTSIAAGNWYLLDFDKVFIQVDNFIDGNFDITKPTLKHWKLNATQNHIKALDGTGSPIDTSAMKIDIEKI